jgi:NADP-dependent 3-hydroxy acid dehydrogenase YdfG
MENTPANSYIECASMLKGSGWWSIRSLKAPDSHPPRVTDLEPGLVGGAEFSATRSGSDKAGASTVYAGTVPLTADGIGEAAAWVAGLPPNMNVNLMEIRSICQAPGPLAIKWW